MDDLDSIIEAINDPDGSAVSDEFREICLRLIRKINRKRRALHFDYYERNRLVILINELHYSALLHRGRVRKSGESVFESHLVGTVENLLDSQNLTGLTSLLSGLKHDDIEDIGLTTDQLFRDKYYRERLIDLDEAYFTRLKQNVYRIVSGITKVKRDTRQRTKEETFKKLLEYIRDHGIRVGYIKIADRIHNMHTLAGHGKSDLAKQRDIALETTALYIPLARLFKTSLAEEELIHGCLSFLNPDFLSEYNKLLAEKTLSGISPYQEEIESLFSDDGKNLIPSIYSLKFQLLPLENLFYQFNVRIPLEDLTINHLPVDEMEPLFEIVIIVKETANISPVIGRVIEKFAVGRLNIRAEELGFNRGTLLRVYNRSFGGRLYFRINNHVSEARSYRGLLANIDDKTPPRLREGIKDILNKVETDSSAIFSIAHQELLKPDIVVYTPRDTAIELPNDATPLDFAGKIHEDVLKGAQKAYISDDIWGKRKKEFPLFDPLPHGVIVYIDSCLSESSTHQSGEEYIKVDPGWLLYCQASARAILARYLRSSQHLSMVSGHLYFSNVSRLCDFSPAEMFSLVRDKFRQFRQKSEEEILMAVGRGEINILEIAASHESFTNRRHWQIEALLPNKPMSLSQFTRKLGPDINIEDTYIRKTRKGELGKVLLNVAVDPGIISPFEFLKVLLKAHYDGYELSVKV